MRRLRSLTERAIPAERSTGVDPAKVASEIEDLVEKAYQLTRSLYKEGVSPDVQDAAVALEHALGEAAKHEVVKLLRAAQG